MTLRLWYFAMINESNLRSRTPRDNYPKLKGRPSIQVIEHNTLYISGYAYFSMYEQIYYWNPSGFDNFPRSGEQIGQRLSVSHNMVQAMCFWVARKKSYSPQ